MKGGHLYQNFEALVPFDLLTPYNYPVQALTIDADV